MRIIDFFRSFAIIGWRSARIEQTMYLLWLLLIRFRALNLAVTVSDFGLKRSWGKVSQAGKFTTWSMPTREINSSANSVAARVEVVTIKIEFFWFKQSMAWVDAGAIRLSLLDKYSSIGFANTLNKLFNFASFLHKRHIPPLHKWRGVNGLILRLPTPANCH